MKYITFITWWSISRSLPDEVYHVHYLMKYITFITWWSISRSLPDEVYHVHYLMKYITFITWWSISRSLPDEVYHVHYLMKYITFITWWSISHSLPDEVYHVHYLMKYITFITWWSILELSALHMLELKYSSSTEQTGQHVPKRIVHHWEETTRKSASNEGSITTAYPTCSVSKWPCLEVVARSGTNIHMFERMGMAENW